MSPVISDWLDDVLAAAAFLTIVPVPHREPPANLARAYRVFPLLGAAIGAAVGTVYLVLLWVGLPAIAAAALALGAGALLTGALHEDGLADLADGFGGGKDKIAKLDVMRDSRLGTYGALALLISFVAKIGGPRCHDRDPCAGACAARGAGGGDVLCTRRRTGGLGRTARFPDRVDRLRGGCGHRFCCPAGDDSRDRRIRCGRRGCYSRHARAAADRRADRRCPGRRRTGVRGRGAPDARSASGVGLTMQPQ